jgi:hypothetical protein
MASAAALRVSWAAMASLAASGNQGKASSRVGLGGVGLQGWVHGGVELAGVAGEMATAFRGLGARKWRANGRNESSGFLQY